MQAVILADKYSHDTVEEIIKNYKKHGITDFILCRTSSCDMIEEYEKNGCKIIDVKLERKNKTGGQILKIANLLDDNTPFFLSFGDYLCGVDLNNLLCFHKSHGRVLSMVVIKENEKQIFGGYMIMDYDALGYINDNNIFEKEPLTKIAEDGELGWYRFCGKYQITYQHMKIYGF